MEKVVDMFKKYGFIALILYLVSTAIEYAGEAFTSGFVGALGWFLTLALVVAFYGLIIYAKLTKKEELASSLSIFAVGFIGISSFLSAFMNMTDMETTRWFYVIYLVLGLICNIAIAGLFALFMVKKLFNKSLVPGNILVFVLLGILGLSAVCDLYLFVVDIIVGAPWFVTLGVFSSTFLMAGLFGEAYTLITGTLGGESAKTKSETKELPPEENKTENADA